jgi:hypothetical protein
VDIEYLARLQAVQLKLVSPEVTAEHPLVRFVGATLDKARE